jgi:hypothetical protein
MKLFSTMLTDLKKAHLRTVYTGDNTLNVVAVASDGDLKRWEDFY